ncbi:MAG: aggregation factor core protein MAFp3, isoform C, partial [Armatimonadota bacterium]|nr:aggregation factor core protein MAFp3, isoform C [Armatimonadota bacterium]
MKKTQLAKDFLAQVLALLAFCLSVGLGSTPAHADGTLEFWGPTFSGEERYGSATIYVQRTGGSTGAVDVIYTTSNGTAIGGQDYTVVTGTLSWAAGDIGSKSFTVPITNDSTQENTETVNLTLSSPTGGAVLGTYKTSVLNIIDNDQPAVLEFWFPTFTGEERYGTATIYVQRTGGSGGAVSVQYATSNGTATAGSDYTATSGTLSWADGDTGSKSFTIPITNDTTQEPTETINVALSNPTNRAVLGTQGTAVVNITDNDEAAILEFWTPTFTGEERYGTATIYVQRTGGSGGAVSVQYATSNGTATAGSDYTTTTGTLSWGDGDTGSKSFTVPITDDALAEAMETVNLTLSNPSAGAVLGTQKTAILNITDNDETAVLEFWAPTFNVNEADGTVNIYVQRTGGSGGAVSVQYATSNGTATAGSDYTARSGTLNWANLDMSAKSFAIPITNDGVVEGTETVNLTLSNPSVGAVLGTQKTAVLNIADNLAGALRFSLANSSVNENAGTATILVERAGGSSGAVSVQYATSNGTATAGSDYTARSGTLSWAAGDVAAKNFTVPITADTLVEGNETVNLTLSNATGGAALGTPASAVLTILDGAAGTLQFALANYSVYENGGTATISVKRTGGSSGAVSVTYATGNRIALVGQDYTARSGTLSWANGDAADKSFTVPIINDTAVEGSEALNLTLTSPTGGAALGTQNTALLTIVDDDFGTLQFSLANYSVNENAGRATISVKRTGGSGGAVSVAYATGNGTATAGSDYTATTGTLSWANGDAADKSFVIPIINDTAVEGNETVNLRLSNATGGALIGAQSTALLTIGNDDHGVLQFGSPTYTVSETGVTATLAVTRTGSGGAISVTYATSNGTATAGSDYTARTGTLSWAAGDTSPKTFTIPITNDTVIEGNEAFYVALSNPTGGSALGAQSSAVVVIADNDTPAAGALQLASPTFSVSESGGTATITLTRSGGSTGAVSVVYATGNGTATAGSDYTAASGTLSWAAGDTAP